MHIVDSQQTNFVFESNSYHQYCQKIRDYNQIIDLFNQESDRWVSLLNSDPTQAMLQSIILELPRNFTLLRTALLDKAMLLNEYDVAQHWFQKQLEELPLQTKKRWPFMQFLNPDKPTLKLKLLLNPTINVVQEVRIKFPEFYRQYRLSCKPQPALSIEPDTFHAARLTTLSADLYLKRKADEFAIA